MDRPALHALLNGTAAVLLLIAWRAVRRWRLRPERGALGEGSRIPSGVAPLRLHVACVSAALLVSTVFLGSYLEYHARVGSVRFWGEGALRWLYLGILVPHTVLAVGNLPMILVTVHAAVRRRWARHRAWARWTLPIWLWVSVSGVLVYLLNHAMRPSAA